MLINMLKVSSLTSHSPLLLHLDCFAKAPPSAPPPFKNSLIAKLFMITDWNQFEMQPILFNLFLFYSLFLLK